MLAYSELKKLYTEREVQKEIYKSTEQLANLAYEANLEEVAEQMDLKVEQTKFFEKNTKQYDAKFVAAAYNDSVLNKGENSKVLELSKDKFIVLKVNDKIAQRQKTFDEVKVEIDKHLANLLSKTFINTVAKKIADAFNSGDIDTAQALMEKSQLSWKDIGWVDRDSKKADSIIISSIFSLPKLNDKPIYGTRSLSEQQSVVLKLSAIKAPKSEINSDLLAGLLLDFESEELFSSILKTLHKNTDIEIFTDNL